MSQASPAAPSSAQAPSGDAGRQRRAPFLLRALILLLSFLAGLLALWLLGFVLDDIGQVERPQFAAYEAESLDAEAVAEERELRQRLEQAETELGRQREIQSSLRASIDNARGTIDQMLAIRRLALEKGVDWDEAESAALSTAQERFLDSQDQLDESLGLAAGLEEQRHQLNAALAVVVASLERQRDPAREAYQDALQRREYRVAAYKLAFLLPVFLAASWLVAKRRGSLYRPLYLALLLAATWQLGAVIHEHFPAEFFKYLALGAGLVVVVAFLVTLLRGAARPSGVVLLRRNREGYRRWECPRCAFPIRTGTEAGPATCASCGLELYRKCEACGETRHSQLPHCESCGAASRPA